VEIGETWSPSSLKAPNGEPITRTVTIRAEGASVGMLPELAGPELPAADIKQYPDQPVTKEEKTSSGLAGQRQQKTALIATRSGTYTVPTMEIPWWNTVTDRMEVARLPAATLTVLPSALSEPPEAIPVVPEKPAAQTLAPDESRKTGTTSQTPLGEGRLWLWLALLFGSAWLFTALGWWFTWRRNVTKPVKSQLDENSTERSLIKAVEIACRANDPAAARRAIEQWVRYRWPDSPPESTEKLLSGTLRRELSGVNRKLFGGGAGAWEGRKLLECFRSQLLDSKRVQGNRNLGDVLEPLNRL
jgi:hypothetical protein